LAETLELVESLSLRRNKQTPIFIEPKLNEGTLGAGNPYRRERLYTVDLLIKVSCFVKNKNI
jgi:hypothetical protein